MDPEKEKSFALTPRNMRLLLVGFAVVALGFILMVGGAPVDGQWYPDGDPARTPDMFSFRRITLAPILVLAGFAFDAWVIIRRQK